MNHLTPWRRKHKDEGHLSVTPSTTKPTGKATSGTNSYNATVVSPNRGTKDMELGEVTYGQFKEDATQKVMKAWDLSKKAKDCEKESAAAGKRAEEARRQKEEALNKANEHYRQGAEHGERAKKARLDKETARVESEKIRHKLQKNYREIEQIQAENHDLLNSVDKLLAMMSSPIEEETPHAQPPKPKHPFITQRPSVHQNHFTNPPKVSEKAATAQRTTQLGQQRLVNPSAQVIPSGGQRSPIRV